VKLGEVRGSFGDNQNKKRDRRTRDFPSMIQCFGERGGKNLPTLGARAGLSGKKAEGESFGSEPSNDKNRGGGKITSKKKKKKKNRAILRSKRFLQVHFKKKKREGT